MAVASISDLDAVAKVITRLRQLLAQARAAKPETTVDPPLHPSTISEGVNALHDDFDDETDQSFRTTTVEAAAREVFYACIKSREIDEPSFVEVWDLLDIILLCGDRGKASPELVCLLLEELLDSQTTHGCRIVFDYLESRRERIAHKDFHRKNLVFLRSCNELLRRLSRAEDAIFCGRVFFFLFQTFPLGDKSSVNLRGEFHVENTTSFDASTTADVPGSGLTSEMDVDSNATQPGTKESTPQPAAAAAMGTPRSSTRAAAARASQRKAPEEELLSTNELYPIFWRLQHDFSDPTRLYAPQHFTAFKKGLASTLAKFKATDTVVQTKSGEEGERGTKRKWEQADASTGSDKSLIDSYNPKYLTSRDLFDLELSDLAFQRHILVQALILLDFLLSLTEKAKKRLATVATPNKSLLYAFTLGDDDTKWAVATRAAITAYLNATTEGRQFCRMVETVLARDRNWVRWKVESCPSIVAPPVATELELAARKQARDVARPRRVPDRLPHGMDFGFLDEGPGEGGGGSGGGGLAGLKGAARWAVPSIRTLVDGIQTDKLDLEMAMDEAETVGLQNAMANKKWRALRQARALDLALLDKVDSTKDLEDLPGLSPDVADVDPRVGEGGSGDSVVATA